MVKPLMPVLFQAAPNQRLNRRRHCLGKTLKIRSYIEDARKNVCDGVAGKGLAASEHLEQHTTKCPYIRLLADFLSSRLFGTHVSGGAKNNSTAGMGNQGRRVGGVGVQQLSFK